MYDIFYVSKTSGNDADWKTIKSKYPLAQRLTYIKSYEEIKSKSFTKLFWCIWDDIELSNLFDLSEYRATKWDQDYVHVFKNKDYFDGICLFPKSLSISQREFDNRFFTDKKEIDTVASTPKLFDTFYINSYNDYLTARENSTTDMFWCIPKEVIPNNDFKFDLYFSHHNFYDRTTNHVFKNKDVTDIKYNGIMLLSKKTIISAREIEYRYLIEKKEYDIVASELKLYDIIFISYNEPNADENFAKLSARYPRVQRVHGVKGIHQAHIAAAKLATTPMFWVVDGDAVIEDNFKFDLLLPKHDRDIVHVWLSKNPINGLIYGYGGVKLLPTELTLVVDVTTPDMTTAISKRFKSMPEVSNITSFNTDPFNTWKSAFRECVKLSSSVIARQDSKETEERLAVWCTLVNNIPYGFYSYSGALAGRQYGQEHADNIPALSKINDFDWLKDRFNEIQS
jgi:hypothetical protein